LDIKVRCTRTADDYAWAAFGPFYTLLSNIPASEVSNTIGSLCSALAQFYHEIFYLFCFKYPLKADGSVGSYFYAKYRTSRGTGGHIAERKIGTRPNRRSSRASLVMTKSTICNVTGSRFITVQCHQTGLEPCNPEMH
jgi:hypothetical protein